MQQNRNLKSINWIGSHTETQIQELMETQKQEFEADLRLYWYKYIISMFQFISTSHDMDASIMEKLKSLDLTRVC